MRKKISYIIPFCLLLLFFVVSTRDSVKAVNPDGFFRIRTSVLSMDTISKDSITQSKNKEFFHQKQEEIKQEIIKRYISTDSTNRRHPDYIGNPSIYKKSLSYDYSNRRFFSETNLSEKYKLSRYKVYNLKDYVKAEQNKTLTDFWREKSAEDAGIHRHSGIIPEINFGGKLFDAIFGSNKIVIKPQGSAELTLGVKVSEVENPTIPESLRKNVMMDFREQIQMNVSGSVGDRLKMDINYNTQATFDFENTIKLTYDGKEDDIIKEIEAGNVSLPLSGTLITGGQNLFGFKTRMQFGKLNVTTLFSQQKGETSVVNLENGAQKKEFSISAVDYEANRHFFISEYFKNRYDRALQNLPVINSPVVITKVEVWVTNKNLKFDKSRNIVAFTKLGDRGNVTELPVNNNLYEELNTAYSDIRDINQVSGTLSGHYKTRIDYEKLENAKLLSANEYTYHPQLGYLSLNRALNSDEVLAVAYEYTLRGNSEPQRVGEFTSDGPAAPSTLYLKLLKATTLSPKMPQWPLMMKNIYNIGAYGAQKDDFQLHIMYRNDEVGTNLNYISTSADSQSNPKINGQVLLKVLNLDKLDRQYESKSDGQFDYIEGITIYSQKGRIIFPVLEPFGEYLESKFDDKILAEKYIFEEIYTESQSDAKQIAEKNKFNLEGTYKSSSSSEVNLNTPNIKPGAVKVVAGSRELVENIDYTVDYAMGKVKIINQGILESGTPVSISSESNSMFSMQTKTLIGTHLDYNISDNFNLGATVLHLSESPLTRKVNIGEEPISNTIWGINGSYTTESGFLTKMVDAIPLIDTKVKSKISVDAEFAHFIPGHNGEIGESYIDDFEGSKVSVSLKSPFLWRLASVPINDSENMFPENPQMLVDTLASGYNRAKLAWYTVDPLFYRTEDPAMPSYIKNDENFRSDHYVREIKQTELFPNKDIAVGDANIISAMNVAFYPKERGPYNYTVEGLNAEGDLKDPEKSWGGIMRRIQSTDFEAANVQYIEFWLLDPFIYNINNTNEGGKLYFDLGDISEDILRDSRKSFENGLPVSENVKNVSETAWGRVPTIQSLINGFDNNASSRKYQDVGLDGLSTEDELSYFQDKFQYLDRIKQEFGADSKAYKLALEDPSADNYHYYRGTDFDNKRLDIASRYKNYNGPEGNSPTADMSPESYSTSATTQPDIEDINQDNTLSETESFYRYEVDIKPDRMSVEGNKYISDVRQASVSLPNGEVQPVKWYQFKIPIKKDNAKVVGDIDGFKSIRFIRMFLKGFRDSINLRMASLSLVRDNWRMYDNQQGEPDYNSSGRIELSSVSLEENAEKQPVNYVLPPDIDRDLSASNSQYTQMNERAMLLKVRDVADGDYRSVFKNVTFDMVKYKRLKMDVHAEEISGTTLDDDDLKIFIRIGTDFRNNYYEYELPLKLTPPGVYSGDNDLERRQVWPDLNRVDIPLEYFQRVKMARNDSRREKGSVVTAQQIFSKTIGELENNNNLPNSKNVISVVGNPTLAEVRTIMIGVKNPKDGGEEKSAEIWVNELRLSDFDESGGWAANVRLNARLADFATVILAGRKIAPGFGSIDQKINQVSREDQFQYDFSTNVQLGKFFPDKWKFRFPMYYAISENTVLPQYDPVDTDIKLSDKLDRYSGAKRDSIKRNAEKYISRKSLNFTNVGVENNGESKIIDLSNLSVSYSYNETKRRDLKTSVDLEKNYRGAVSYVYSGRAKNVTPFKKMKIFKSPYLALIRDFNFYYLPSRFSVRTDMTRTYHEVQGRNLDNPLLKIDPSYDKNIDWNRYYDLKFDLTKNLQFDFSASSMSKIDETDGMVDPDRDRDGYERWRDTVWNSIMAGGRAMHYNHNFTASYNIPINKIPLLSWVNANARYTGSFDWQAGPAINEDVELGNEIRNTGSKQLNTRFNLLKLYNSSKWLRGVNNKYSGRKSSKKTKKVRYVGDLGHLRNARKVTVKHNLHTDNIKIRVFDENKRRVVVKYRKVDKNRLVVIPQRDVKNASIKISGIVELKDSFVERSAGFIARMLMSVRNVSIAYTENNRTNMYGYLPSSSYLGTDRFNGGNAPGFDFITGLSGADYGVYAANRGWVTKDEAQNSPFTLTTNNVLYGRAIFEPLNGLKINLTVRRTFSNNNSQYITYNEGLGSFESVNEIESGGFSMTYMSLNSSFFAIGKDTKASRSAYDKFLSNRLVESERLAKNKYGADVKPNADGFYDGYGGTSQEVLIPAFLSAYGYGNSKELFPGIWSMLPNWNVRYSGLRKLDLIRDYFQSFNIKHSYSCTYNVGAYMTNSFYGIKEINDLTNNVYPQYDVSSVSIEERFNPLIGVDMVWKNSFTTRVEINRKRSLALSLTNSQLTEAASNEFILGLGYRFKHLPIIIKQTEVDNNLNLRCDFSLRKNNSIIRKVEEGVSQLTSGQEVMSVKLSADYTLNNRFNLRLFYDRVINDPYVSLSYRTINSNFGLSVRFTLIE